MPPDPLPPTSVETPPAGPQPLFISCAPGKLLARFGLTNKVVSYIGAERGVGRSCSFFPERVVMIPAAEVERHGRVYERYIADKDAVRRTAKDFEQQNNRGADASPNGSAPPAGGTDT